MSIRQFTFTVVVVALALGGFLMSQANPPPPYVIPADLGWFSPTFRCPTGTSDKFANYVGWNAPHKRLVVGIQELSPVTGQWVSAQYVYSTSYHVLDVAYRLGGQELYVSGILLDRFGGYTDIIERWEFPTVAGGTSVAITGGVTQIGIPRAAFSGTVTIVGGSYIAPQQRNATPQPLPNQSIIYSEPSGGHYNCIVADPEGRFLLLHNYATGDLSSLDLSSATPVLQLVHSPAQIPALTQIRSMMMHDVPSVGRICRLSPQDASGAPFASSAQVVVLVDPQNDGNFDSFSLHSAVEVALGQTAYGDSITWNSVTNFGWDWVSEF